MTSEVGALMLQLLSVQFRREGKTEMFYAILTLLTATYNSVLLVGTMYGA